MKTKYGTVKKLSNFALILTFRLSSFSSQSLYLETHYISKCTPLSTKIYIPARLYNVHGVKEAWEENLVVKLFLYLFWPCPQMLSSRYVACNSPATIDHSGQG